MFFHAKLALLLPDLLAHKPNMEPSGWKCPHCSRILRSERGRTQHINSSPACRQQRHDEVFSQQLDQDDAPSESRRSKRLRLANRQLDQDANLPANLDSTPPSPEASDSETAFNPPEQEDSNTDPDDENGDHGDISSAAAGTTDENTDSEPDSNPDAKPQASTRKCEPSSGRMPNLIPLRFCP